MRDEDFTASLYFGQCYERIMVELFQRYYDSVELAPNKCFKDWDANFMRIDYEDDGSIKDNYEPYESKCDTLALSSGNMAIEYRSKGEKSGIDATTAKFWIHFIHDPTSDVLEYYKIPTAVLRKMIREEQWDRNVDGGYKGYSSMYLFRRSAFEKYKRTIEKSKISDENRGITNQPYTANKYKRT